MTIAATITLHRMLDLVQHRIAPDWRHKRRVSKADSVNCARRSNDNFDCSVWQLERKALAAQARSYWADWL